MAQIHECKRPSSCCCSISALEPSDDCPVHNGGEWPPRCYICGRFMKWARDPGMPFNDCPDIRRFIPNGELLYPDDWDVGMRD